MSKLTKMESNIFTTKLIDIMLPEGELDHVFLIMSLGEADLKEFIYGGAADQMDDIHLSTILYNMLCSLNFLHSVNVIHRDIKPSNLLIDDECGILLCDFGLSRVIPTQTELNKDIEACR